MIKKLVAIRLKGMLDGLTSQARKKGKSPKGITVLLVVAFVYIALFIGGMMAVNFYTLAQPYHQMGLDWLYFAMAGMMALCLAIIGSVFTTQSQLYDARDNFLLLSMPIPPGKILLSRMIPLLMMNLLFASLVMVPAIVVYGIFVEFRFLWLVMQLLGMAAVVLLSQSICCILGWLLHKMLSHMNKTFASLFYLVIFLGVYFWAVSQAQNLLNAMIGSSQSIADALFSWVWPLYAMGQGSIGNLLHGLALPAISVVIFGIVYWVLSSTFVKTATATSAPGKKRKLDLDGSKQASAMAAVIRKEQRKFLRTPIYLTNMGIGILMLACATVAGIFLRNDLLAALSAIPQVGSYIPLIIFSLTGFMISTMSISTPSVSLEGKSIWIMKSLPISAKEILLAKLAFHCRIAIPVPVIAGGVLAAVYGCNVGQIILCAALPGILALFNGLLGMLSGLKWARLDFISEAYPCKQSVSVAVSMFGTMGLAFLLLIGCALLSSLISLVAAMGIIFVLLAVLCAALYRVLITWGPKKWNQLL